MFECKICGAETPPGGPCRGCGAPGEVDGSATRRPGKSVIAKLEAELERARPIVKAAKAWHAANANCHDGRSHLHLACPDRTELGALRRAVEVDLHIEAAKAKRRADG